jgi:hypothetical protein
MPNRLSIDEKVAVLRANVLPCLRNDLRRVCESTCGDHGVPGSGPNFTAALLCMVACEALGRMTSDPSLDDDEATVAFIQGLSDASGDPRYREAASPVLVFFRHGIVHSFMPKQPGPVNGTVAWAVAGDAHAGVCVDFLRTPAGSQALASLRDIHMSVTRGGERSVFTLVPQVMCVDVMAACDAIETAVTVADSETRATFNAGFDKWWGRLADRRVKVDAAGRRYLGV